MGIGAILLGTLSIYYFKYQHQQLLENLEITNYKLPLEAVNINYGKAIETEAKMYNLDPNYFKALCALECGGRKDIPSRFEKHIYRRLVRLKKGQINTYEDIKSSSISMLSDDGIKNLARSWGPFQIMGYKSVGLNCKVVNLRDKNAIKYGIKWINKNYGNTLRNEKFKDAFHLHNTGRKFPSIGPSRTHDPEYVAKGLKFMQYFKLKAKSNSGSS